MLKTITAIKVRQNLGRVMNEVALKEDEYIVERSGKPLVAIIPIDQYLSMKKERKDFFRMADEIRSGMNKAEDDVIDIEISEAVSAVRKKSRQTKKTAE